MKIRASVSVRCTKPCMYDGMRIGEFSTKTVRQEPYVLKCGLVVQTVRYSPGNFVGDVPSEFSFSSIVERYTLQDSAK